ncbi:NADPH-dependent 2,4-dienoyl-CoA reductase/sulfur reductase-like enzyme [Actinomadura pelletieri DSM 43383]|uniref:NADPH-dependent 2,4-dienoyl-CoA reductase/sulfur reductase-like enzyme n=1 Tax=Actinomadura pelletieri DSM 43383 TaxID=1120940 RepID=A0A495QT55_9ACTN|nr:FAD-dependent oxidoreductase [Actinomadura pelletieri]RKS76685.1 NADPH-dependent 2,4-dienoyl-CoA reductase/sulfur reductase-like enzyme [Actinomadura pelletieri DSM 43383]
MSGDTPRRVVIVGGGLAGHTAAVTLRDAGYDGGITMLTAEPRPPYDRPPLSKELLAGTVDDSTLQTDLADLDVDLRLRCRALRLRPDAVDSTGGAHRYDAVVLATGSSPIGLGGTSRSVHELRTVEDARRLRAALREAGSVAVVGAGWVGNEVATRAAALDLKVTVIDAAPTPLARALPAALGEHLVPWFAAQGIDLRLRTLVDGVDERGVRLTGGGRVDADIVVTGIGARPDTGWLLDSGVPLAPDGAVEADATLRAGPGPVYAAGDIVRWPSRLFGARIRVEHWDHAAASARTAARNLLGHAEPYDPVPYFWSDQLGHRLQYVGHHHGADRLVLRGDPAGEDPWSALWFHGERLRAALAVDNPRDARDARRRIAGPDTRGR